MSSIPPFRVLYAAKDFQTGLTIVFRIFNMQGIMLHSVSANELGALGIYTYVIQEPVVGEYIVGIIEGTTDWKTFKYLNITEK